MNNMKLKENEVFIGVMLSDGYIRKIRSKTNNTYFEMKQVIKNIDYINATKLEFESLGYNCQTKVITQGLKNTKKTYMETLLWTNSSNDLGLERQHWYPKGIKIVPRDINLTPKILAYWHMGDGGVWRGGKNKNSVKITLYTNSFTEDEVNLLIEKLEKIGINGTKCKKVNGFILNIGKWKSVVKFMDYVKPYILSCFQYKLQYPRIENKGGAPSRTKEAQSAYYHSLPLKERQKRGKITWDKVKNKRNRQRRLRYKNDKEYRELIKQKVMDRYNGSR